MDSKAQIRNLMRSLGPDSDPGSLWQRLESLPQFQEARTVLMYWSIPGEPFSHNFVAELSSRKRVVLPRVVGERLELRLYDATLMVPGYRGILEPGPDAQIVPPSEIDFAVIPGVAFDRRGGRLGRGKGYYDRTLPSLLCPKAGVCPDSHVIGTVPLQSHDIPVDMVITPNNLYICKL